MEEKLNISATVKGMKPGETLAFGIKRMGTVKTVCSYCALVNERKYRTHCDSKTRQIFVTRIY